MQIPPLLTLLVSLLASFSAMAAKTPPVKPVSGMYAPSEEKVLVFVGQDNASVGGNGKWDKGYYDTVGIPAGITHYVYFTEGKENRFGYRFDKGTVDGLNKETTWGSGPMCMRCYLESDKAKNSIIHLSISMEFDDEEDVAKGKYDHNIQELAEFLKEFSHFPFIIRIAYEFDGSWNNYKPKPFKKAWRRIVDHLRKENVTNFATLMASFTVTASQDTWEEYWPGDEYVDWIGYSYWSGGNYPGYALQMAREKGLPVFIAEAAPRGFFLNQIGGMVWIDWFLHFFNHVEANKDVIRAISYINANWDAQPMWEGKGWGNSNLQENTEAMQAWLGKMEDPLYVHGTKGTYDLINFTPAK